MALISPTNLRAVFHRKELPPFHNLLNLWAVDDGVLVGVDLQFSFIYHLTSPDLRFYNEGELSAFFTCIGRTLDVLPPNCTLQFIVRARKGNPDLIDKFERKERPKEEIIDFIVKERTEFLKSLPIQKTQYYMVLTTYPDGVDLDALKTSNLSLTVEDTGKVTSAMHEKRLKELKKVAFDVLSNIRDAKVQVTILTDPEIYKFFYEYLNPSRAQLIKNPPTIDPEKTLRSQIVLNACEANFDNVYVDGYYYRAINMLIRPKEISFDKIADLVDDLLPDFDLCVNIHSVNRDQAVSELNRIGTTSTVIQGLNFLHTYHEAAMKSSEAEELVESVKTSFQKLYLVSLCAMVRDTSVDNLTIKADKALQSFHKIGEAEGIIDDMNHLPLFLSMLPNHSHLNQRVHVVPTMAAAQFPALCAAWQGCQEPEFVVPTDDNQLCPIEFFSKEELNAKHALLLGSSGAGKSVATNAILTSFYSSSEMNHIIVIDDGGSYKPLCDLLKGQYLEPELDGSYHFNPFLPKKFALKITDQGQTVLDAEFLSFLTTMVQRMLKRNDLTNNEKSIIQRAVMRTYEQTLEDPPLLGDLQGQFLKYAGDEEDVRIARDFGKNLDLWTQGAFGQLLNRRGSIDVSSRFIVFDLNKLKDPDLKPVVFLIIQSVIYPKLNDKRIRKLIPMDEVWKWLRESVGAAMAEEWFKTGRRFNAAIMVITQSAADLLKSSAAAAIIENSPVKYVLDLGGGYDLLPQFKITDEEISYIKDLGKDVDKTKYRKIFLKFGTRRRILKNMLAKTEYWTYTTDPDEVNQRNKLQKEHPEWTNVQIIKELASWSSEKIFNEIKAMRERGGKT